MWATDGGPTSEALGWRPKDIRLHIVQVSDRGDGEQVTELRRGLDEHKKSKGDRRHQSEGGTGDEELAADDVLGHSGGSSAAVGVVVVPLGEEELFRVDAVPQIFRH